MAAGHRARSRVAQQGSGKPWLTVQSLAAIPLKAPLSTGYSIARSVSAVEQKDKARWSRGDVVRVRLEVDAQADMTWVVVDDPMPARRDASSAPASAATRRWRRAREKRAGSAWPAFEERTLRGLSRYYDYVPQRQASSSSTRVRLNNPGTFELPATRVEAMYAPEMLRRDAERERSRSQP